MADEVENDGGDDTKQTKLLLPAPMPPVPLLPSLPSSIIHHSPDPPFFALSVSPDGWSRLDSSVVVCDERLDGAEKDERTNERTNHSHFQKMRAAQKITSRLPSLRRNETKRGKGGREGRAHMDQIKGRLASNIGRQASEEGAPLSSCLVSSFVRSPLTIPPLSSEVGWRRSAPRLPVEPRCEEERERTIERRSLRSARSLSPLRASREGKGGREGVRVRPTGRAGGRSLCRVGRGEGSGSLSSTIAVGALSPAPRLSRPRGRRGASSRRVRRS